MTLSRAQKRAAMAYILETLFDQDKDSPLHKSFKENGITSPQDLVSIEYDVMDLFEYTDPDGALKPLPRGNIGLMKAFKAFVHHRVTNQSPITDSDWLKITVDEFNMFRISTPLLTSSPSVATPPRALSHDPVRDFRRGIKRDISSFIPLKTDNAWDNWNRSTAAQAHAQDVADVLNPKYVPLSTSDRDLFAEKQKYMYAVFEKNLLTDVGKALVRKYQSTFDAQRIYDELSQYALQSTQATMDASTLLQYITTARLGHDQWKGTLHAFILHWQDQVRKYHDLNPSQQLSHELQRTLLENAVHPIGELRAVKTQAAQHKTQTGKDLTYEQYSSLLKSAAQQYDRDLLKPVTRSAKRHIYEHEFLAPDTDHPSDDELFNIDSDVVPYSIFNTTVPTP